jgi:hypothetical protein
VSHELQLLKVSVFLWSAELSTDSHFTYTTSSESKMGHPGHREVRFFINGFSQIVL